MRKRVSVGLLVLLVATATVAAWWVGRTAFVRFALDRAVQATDGRLSYSDVRGTLLDGVRIGRLEWRDPAGSAHGAGTGGGQGAGQRTGQGTERGGDAGALAVRVDELLVRWRPLSLLQRELDFSRVSARSVLVSTTPGGEAARLPDTLELPIALRLRDARVGRLRIERAGTEPIELNEIALSARYREGGYRIDSLRALSEYGALQLNANLADSAPFALVAGVQFDANWRKVSAAALVDGNLGALRITAAASAADRPQRPSGLVSARTVVKPFEQAPLAPVELRADGFDPASIGIAPEIAMRVSGDAVMQVDFPADSGARVDAKASLENALAGPLDAGRLPVERIAAAIGWRDGLLTLGDLSAALAGGGRVSGEVSVDTRSRFVLAGRDFARVDARLALVDVDLASFGLATGRTRLGGKLVVDGPAFEIDATDGARGGVALQAAGRVDGERLEVARALLRSIPGLADGQIEAAGTLVLSAPYQASLAGRFARLDPSRIAAVVEQVRASLPGSAAASPSAATSSGAAAAGGSEAPAVFDALSRLPGSVDGRWALEGPLAQVGASPLRVELDLDEGRLAGLVARGSVRARVAAQRIDAVRVDLRLGETRFEASGSLGAVGDRMAFDARAGSLAQLARIAGVDGLAGSVRASGSLGGRFDAPAISLQASASELALPGEVRIGSLEVSASLPELRAGLASARLDVQARARALSAGGRAVRSLRVDASGSLGEHRFSLEAEAGQDSVKLAGSGQWADERWRATLAELASGGRLALRLAGPVSVSVVPGAFEAGPATIEAPFGSVKLARASWRDGRFEVAGEAAIARLAPLAAAFGATLPDAGGELNLEDVGLDLRVDLSGSSLDDLGGSVFARLRSPQSIAAAGEADVSLRDGRVSGPLELSLPSLAFTNRIVGPEWLFDGRLRFSGSVGGTLRAPRLTGDLRGDRLRLEQRAMGWRLGDGTLVGRFDGERFRVESLKLQSRAKGGGSVEMRGEVLAANLEGRFDFVADRLVVPIGPGQRVVLSGDASASSTGGRFEIRGKLRADEGRIELAGGDAPKLPDDVVIRGAGASHGAAGISSDTSKLQIAADLALDHGGKLSVHGNGVDARLSGVLELRGNLPDAPRAYGTVSVAEGTYRAYGQKLDITRGRVIFNGPIDNPVLDIVALRREQPVEAGVVLSGTALSPKIRLTSQPDVPDAQKLSWLVLGVGLADASSGAQGAALQAAAATLFGSNDGGMSGGLKEALGIDVLTVRSASSGAGLLPSDFGAGGAVPGQIGGGSQAVPGAAATENVVAVGKRLGSRLYLSYEQGLRGAYNLLRIQYDITRRLSLRAQTGSESALDLLFRYSFD